MGHHWRPVQTADRRGPVWESRDGDPRGPQHWDPPPPTVGLIIQTLGNQRAAASIWQTDYGDGQAGLVGPANASTLYHPLVGRLLPRSCA
jgi:hypothetical protein